MAHIVSRMQTKESKQGGRPSIMVIVQESVLPSLVYASE